MKLLKIAGWNEHFENNRSRTVTDLKWVAIPNRHDGEGYSRLMSDKNAAEIFTVWILLLQVASRCKPRGSLIRNDGMPMDLAMIAIRTRAPLKWFTKSVPFLKQIGWVEESASDCQSGDSQLTGDCQAGDEGREGNGKEGKEMKGTATADSSDSETSDEAWLSKIRALPAYAGINIDRELSKMDAWFLSPKGKGRKKTRGFILNWLNKIDVPVSIGSPAGTPKVFTKDALTVRP